MSCEKEADETPNFHQLNIEVNDEQLVNYFQFLVRGDTLIAYNYSKHRFDQLSLDSNKVFDKSILFQLEKEGPNSTGAPKQFYEHEGKIYFWDTFNQLVMIHPKMDELKKYDLNNEYRDIELSGGNGISFNEIRTNVQYNSQIIRPLFKPEYRTSANYYDSLYFMKIDLLNLQTKIYAFEFPKEFRQYSWPLHDKHFVQQVADQKFIITFQGISDIFLAEPGKPLHRYNQDLSEYGLSNQVKPKSRQITQIEALADLKYLNGSPRFGPIYYDVNKRVYYRLVKGETDGAEYEATYNLHLLKYDENFNMIKHTKLPKGVLARMALGKNSLYFFKSPSVLQREDQLEILYLNDF